MGHTHLRRKCFLYYQDISFNTNPKISLVLACRLCKLTDLVRVICPAWKGGVAGLLARSSVPQNSVARPQLLVGLIVADILNFVTSPSHTVLSHLKMSLPVTFNASSESDL